MTATFIPTTDTNDADCACGAVLPTVADVFLHTCPVAEPAVETTDDPGSWEVRVLPPREPRPEPARRNRFAAACILCGQRVPEMEGSLSRPAGGRWEVRHHDDPCPEAPVGPTVPGTEATNPLPDVPAGYYAIPSGGSNDLTFLRVDRPTEGRWAGYTFLRMVVGGHPDRRVPRAQVRGFLQAILDADPTEASKVYGREIGRCGRCNRHLTDEVSRAYGLGPTCRSL